MSDLQMGKPICLNGTNIIPIEKVYLRNFTLGKGFWLYGSKEPVSVVVCDAHGVRTLDIQAHGLSLTELVREVPGLEAVLEEFTAVGN
jgi:uncharacterized spore protein YtfJ